MPKGDKLTTSEYPSESSVPIDAHIRAPRNFPPMSKSEKMVRKSDEQTKEAYSPRDLVKRGPRDVGKARSDTEHSESTPMTPLTILDKDRMDVSRGVY